MHLKKFKMWSLMVITNEGLADQRELHLMKASLENKEVGFKVAPYMLWLKLLCWGLFFVTTWFASLDI